MAKMFKTVVDIDGMMCGMCENRINDALRAAFPIKKVSSSHSRGQAEIISREPLSEDAIKSTIDATGYQVTGISTEPYEKKGFFSRR